MHSIIQPIQVGKTGKHHKTVNLDRFSEESILKVFRKVIACKLLYFKPSSRPGVLKRFRPGATSTMKQQVGGMRTQLKSK